MATTHPYSVTVQWQGGRDGAGTLTAEKSGVSVPLGVPEEFQGTGIGTNPEELLTGAIASCYSITFGIIAANRKLPVKSLVAKVEGQVDQSGASFIYQRIVLRPTIILDASATDEQLKLAEDMAHKADAYCLVTNAVRGKVEIAVEPTIERE